jgi:hypothetical protein
MASKGDLNQQTNDHPPPHPPPNLNARLLHLTKIINPVLNNGEWEEWALFYVLFILSIYYGLRFLIANMK